MTIYEQLTKANFGEMVQFFVKMNQERDPSDSPWYTWLNENFCQKCEPIKRYGSDFAPCEFGKNKCPFDVAKLTDGELITRWLRAEIK